MPETLLVALIAFAGMFVLAFTGFGGALVMVPLMISVVGTQATTPLVRLIGITTTVVSVLRYRNNLNWRAGGLLMLWAAIGIPLGFWLHDSMNQRQAEVIIGGIVVAYALYAWFTPTLPDLKSNVWAYLAGLTAGIMTGSFAIPGPPVILYATARRWPPKEFKSTLQAFFMFTGSFSGVGHFLRGDFTMRVLTLYGWALPGILIGTVLGIYLGERIDSGAFRKLVLILLFVLGMRLIF